MEQEHAADDRVLAAGGSARAYARSLLHLATPGGERVQARACGVDGRHVPARAPAAFDHRVPPPGIVRRPLSCPRPLCSPRLATLVVAAGVPVSASPTFLGPLQARPTGMASALEPAADSGPAEEPSTRAGRVGEGLPGDARPGKCGRALADEPIARRRARPQGTWRKGGRRAATRPRPVRASRRARSNEEAGSAGNPLLRSQYATMAGSCRGETCRCGSGPPTASSRPARLALPAPSSTPLRASASAGRNGLETFPGSSAATKPIGLPTLHVPRPADAVLVRSTSEK